MTSTEFVRWAVFLRMESEETTLTHYYLAQIAEVIVKGLFDPKRTKKTTLKDYLIRFKDRKKRRTPMTVDEATTIAKSIFGVVQQKKE